MYNICRTRDTYADPVTTFCPVAGIIDEDHKFADICIYAEGTPSAKIYLNSHMLLEALENGKALLEELSPKPVKAEPKAKPVVEEVQEPVETVEEKPKKRSLRELQKEAS